MSVGGGSHLTAITPEADSGMMTSGATVFHQKFITNSRQTHAAPWNGSYSDLQLYSPEW